MVDLRHFFFFFHFFKSSPEVTETGMINKICNATATFGVTKLCSTINSNTLNGDTFGATKIDIVYNSSYTTIPSMSESFCELKAKLHYLAIL